MSCSTVVYANDLNLLIRTSDVSIYNGSSLIQIVPVSGAGLNEIIDAIDQSLIALNTLINSKTYDSDDILYAGSFSSCFTITPGSTSTQVFDQLATLICGIDTTLNAIDPTKVVATSFNHVSLPLVANLKLWANGVDAEFTGVETDVNNTKTDLTTLDTRVTNSFNVATRSFATDTTQFTQSSVGLNATIAAGIAIVVGKYISFAGGVIALTATQDNYVYVSNAATPVLSKVTVAVGNPAPATPANTMLLWRLTTNGAAVTVATDDRNYAGTPVNSVKADSIQDTTIADIKLTTSGVTAATYPFASVTVNNKGRITSAVSPVAFSGLANYDVMQYNSGTGKWINLPINARILPAGTAGDFLQYDGADWQPFTPTLASLIGDVTIGGLADGDLLQYDSGTSMWVNVPGSINSVLYSAQMTITSAEALALFTTPKKIISATGAGTTVDVVSVLGRNAFNTTAYAGNAMAVRYTGGVDVAVFTAGFTTSAVPLQQKLTAVDKITALPNTAVEVYIKTADPTLGDSDFIIDVLYRITTI